MVHIAFVFIGGNDFIGKLCRVLRTRQSPPEIATPYEPPVCRYNSSYGVCIVFIMVCIVFRLCLDCV